MILRNYGIELRSINLSDIEEMRKWRNDPFVRKKMFYQEEITAAQQRKWFDSLQESDQYYIIHFAAVPIGVINVKNIDFEHRTGEAGIFIGVNEYRQSFVPMLSILCMMDAFFNDFNFSELNASLRSDNREALKFNLDLGYVILHQDDKQTNIQINSDSFQKQMEAKKAVLDSFNRISKSLSLSDEEIYTFRLK